jgi:hypothetical protein
MPDFDTRQPQEAGQEDGAATTKGRVASIATKAGTLLMANKLWVACVLVGVIVLVELAAGALWLLSMDDGGSQQQAAQQLHELLSKWDRTKYPNGTQALQIIGWCQGQKYAADHGTDRLQEFIDNNYSDKDPTMQEKYLRMGYSCTLQEARARGIKYRKQVQHQHWREEQLRKKLEKSGVTCDGVALSESGDCKPIGEDYWMLCDAPTRAAVVADKTECVYGGGGS